MTHGLVPSRAASLAGGAGERIALGLAVQVGEPGLADGSNDGVKHRCLLGNVTGRYLEGAAKTGRPASGDRLGSGAAGYLDSRGWCLGWRRSGEDFAGGAGAGAQGALHQARPGSGGVLAREVDPAHGSGYDVVIAFGHRDGERGV